MPTIAFCSISAMDRSLADAATLAARCGADGIEVTARASHLDAIESLDGAKEMGDRARSAGLEVTAYGSYLSYAGTGYEAQVQREVERARALGTRRIRVWAGHAQGADEERRGDVVALLRAVGERAGDAGIEVVVERHLGSFADTVERTLALLDEVALANVTLNYQVLDSLPLDAASEQPDDARLLIPRSTYFHVKNYRPNPVRTGPMLLGGDLREGVLDYRAIFAAAVEAGYRGPYAIEFVAFDERPLEGKLAADVAYLREVLARVGAP